MVSIDDVKKLAALARIRVADADLPRFVKEFEGILEYVGQLAKLELPKANATTAPRVRNVLREDGEPHAAGEWTETLAAQFPDRDGDALRVKQIISHD